MKLVKFEATRIRGMIWINPEHVSWIIPNQDGTTISILGKNTIDVEYPSYKVVEILER